MARPRERSTAGGNESAVTQGRRGPRVPRTVFTLSEDETRDLGASLARDFRGGELVLLEGDLGAGKTVFARGMAAGLGIAVEDVRSPSFTLVNEYRGGRLVMYHVDLYRLEQPQEELAGLGLDELLAGRGVVAVEWGERLPPYYRREAIVVRLTDVGEGARRVEIVLRTPAKKPRRGDA
jgi:tRNA threonylcarbamoyladenosine biosynthesis protein TsaE